MTLKPPTRTFPKLVMKDFDEEEMKVLGALADLDDRDFFATVMGDCGETHRSLKERLDCAACNHAIATNSRPWMAEDHPLEDAQRAFKLEYQRWRAGFTDSQFDSVFRRSGPETKKTRSARS